MSSDHDDHAFDPLWWEEHYRGCETRSLGDPTPYVTDDLAVLQPGTILEAGCGTGVDAIWLAHHGWEVTAVDVSPTAIGRARDLADQVAPDAASGITWLAEDLMSWEPPDPFDVVISQYVHPDAPFDQFVDRLARAVAPGGTLLVVGHEHSDSHSAAHSPHDASVSAPAIAEALDPREWTIDVAESRERRVVRDDNDLTLTDIVVRARRRP